MTDYRAFIALVNREDLLRRAVESSYDVLPELTVIDNSPHGITFDPGCKVFRAPMPIQFSHSMNYAMLETRRQGAHICLWMHCDAWAPEGAYLKLIEAIHGYEAEGRKWGVVFTNYDALVAINTALIDDVGLWDNNIPWYFSDNDFYRRVRLGGYETIDTGIEVHHDYSQTLKSDPEVSFLNSILFPMYQQFYRAKWGWVDGKETFDRPFNRP